MRKHKSLWTRIFLLSLIFVMMSSHSTRALGQSDPAPKEKSLYERIGGYDALSLVVDEFMKRLADDKQLARFLVGLSDDSKKRLRQHLLNQFCQATGGPCIYTGREMKTAHTGLKITESDWDRAARALVETLDKFKVPKKEKDEVVAFVLSLKKDVVGL